MAPRRLNRAQRAVIAALLAVTMLGLATCVGVPAVQKAHLQRTLSAEAAAQRAAALSTIDHDTAETLTDLAAKGQGGPVVYAAVHDLCFYDSGWMVNKWLHVCRLTKIEVREGPADSRVYGINHIPDQATSLPADTLEWAVRRADTPSALSPDWAQPIRSSGSPTLDPTKHYVVIWSSRDYHRHVMGCAEFRGPFCENPLE